jgi:hypothetical protein
MRVAAAAVVGALLNLALAAPVSAQVQLSIHDGRVSLAATNVTVRQILMEWARVGQTKIVNVERIPGGPVTLALDQMPEAEALDLLLKSVTGYMAAPRPVNVPTLSRYDRILVLPTAAVARVPVTGPPPPVFQQPVMEPVNQEDVEGPSFPPRGTIFPAVPQPQPGIAIPQVVDDQVNFPAQMGTPPPPQPGTPLTFPGASAVGTPRPGMVLPQPTPNPPGPGLVFPGQPPPPPPDN